MGDYRDTKVEINCLIEEQIKKTPQASKSAVVLEANKVLIGSYLLQPDHAPPKKLILEELVPVFDRCKDMASPNIRNKVMNFRFLRKFGVMDSITKFMGTVESISGPLFRTTNSEVKVLTLTRLFPSCQKLSLVVG